MPRSSARHSGLASGTLPFCRQGGRWRLCLGAGLRRVADARARQAPRPQDSKFAATKEGSGARSRGKNAKPELGQLAWLACSVQMHLGWPRCLPRSLHETGRWLMCKKESRCCRHRERDLRLLTCVASLSPQDCRKASAGCQAPQAAAGRHLGLIAPLWPSSICLWGACPASARPGPASFTAGPLLRHKGSGRLAMPRTSACFRKALVPEASPLVAGGYACLAVLLSRHGCQRGDQHEGVMDILAGECPPGAV